MNPRQKNLFLFLLGLAAICVLFIYLGVIRGDLDVALENHSMENTQAVMLGVAALVFLARGIRANAARLPCFLLAVLCFSFLLREIDVDDPALGVNKTLIYFIQGRGRNIILLPLWLWVLVGIVCNFRTFFRDFLYLFLTTPGLLFCFGGWFLSIAADSEYKMFHSTYQTFIEELLEVIGYGLILGTAILHTPDAPWPPYIALRRLANRFLPRALRIGD